MGQDAPAVPQTREASYQRIEELERVLTYLVRLAGEERDRSRRRGNHDAAVSFGEIAAAAAEVLVAEV